MKKIILIIALLAQFLSPVCFAAGILESDIPSYVKTPDDIAKWFSHDFKYQLIIPNTPQTLEETLKTRGGDCDDFAALAYAVLARMGISGSVAVIMFKDSYSSHSVCIWMEADGTYSFISNQEIYHTGEKTPEGAIKKVYPAYRKIVLNFDRREQGRYYR
jgi:hypothetical protein